MNIFLAFCCTLIAGLGLVSGLGSDVWNASARVANNKELANIEDVDEDVALAATVHFMDYLGLKKIPEVEKSKTWRTFQSRRCLASLCGASILPREATTSSSIVVSGVAMTQLHNRYARLRPGSILPMFKRFVQLGEALLFQTWSCAGAVHSWATKLHRSLKHWKYATRDDEDKGSDLFWRNNVGTALTQFISNNKDSLKKSGMKKVTIDYGLVKMGAFVNKYGQNTPELYIAVQVMGTE